MDAVFTLPYSEFAIAELLISTFKAHEGYSVFVPVSRSEKGVDLVLTRRSNGVTKTATFQVKSSRTYAGTAPKRKVKHRRFQHYTWLNRFDVPEQADFVILIGLYAPDERSGHKTGRSWWKSHVLVFSHKEASALLASVKTRKGSPDRMFGFGFDSSDQAYLTRGSELGEQIDFSAHLFERQITRIRQRFNDDRTTPRKPPLVRNLGSRRAIERKP